MVATDHNSMCGPEHMEEERVHFSGERESSKRTEHSSARGEVKRADSREC